MGELDRYGEGKCINCVFLGKRDSRPSMAICYEASSFDRLGGDFTFYSGTVNTFATCIWCFVGEALFHQEMMKEGITDNDYDKVHELTKKDRNCKSWYKWKEFRPPKELYEEFKMMQLEQDRKDFELKIENDRRKFECDMQEMNERSKRRTDNIMIGLAVAGVIFALAQVFVAFR